MPETPGDRLTQLGQRAAVPATPAEAVLETIANADPEAFFVVRLTCPEFTTLCPVTGQPDFAHLVIDYLPHQRLVESKSFKLFLQSFRDVGGFHESTTLAIAAKIRAAAEPRWLRIGGYWFPRGGIPIDVFYQTGAPPAGLWLPEQAVPPYRGR
ncbi:MAG: preQ(1) synthase [Defluviicoccus sp.]|nr:preQ(1) synthase [Defluviicoccus sp.]